MSTTKPFPMDDYLGVQIVPIDRDQNPNVPETRLVNATLVFLSGRLKGMQVTGFSIGQSGRRRYVNGPAHWWTTEDNRETQEKSDEPPQKSNGVPKRHSVEYFRSTDPGLKGIPQDVQDVFLAAYDAYTGRQKAPAQPARQKEVAQ